MRAPANMNKRIPAFLALLFCFALVAGCETTQSGAPSPAASVLGAAVGSVLPGAAGVHADSVVRVATAFGKTFQDITPEQEYYIGRTVAATVLVSYPPYQDPEATRYINVLGQTLAQASDRPETFGGYHFLILDSAEVNAFAAPGGLILVTRGMIRLCKTEDALAAVLAHEISHVQFRHGLASIKSNRFASFAGVVGAEAAKSYSPAQLSQLTEIFEGTIGDITTTLMTKGYSRELEREADKGAVTILKRVGYDPSSLEQLLTAMQKNLKPGGPGFIKTHPDPGDRAKDIRPLAAGSPVKPGPLRQQRFQKVLGAV
jgi:predicted Zn-dependent protease